MILSVSGTVLNGVVFRRKFMLGCWKYPFEGANDPKTDILVLPEFTSVVFGGILQNQTIFDKDLGLVRWILSENYFYWLICFFRLVHPIFTIPSILLQVIIVYNSCKPSYVWKVSILVDFSWFKKLTDVSFLGPCRSFFAQVTREEPVPRNQLKIWGIPSRHQGFQY